MPSKSELQNLLRKMGGTPESGDSVDETIKKISEVYEPGGGGGSGLPEGGSAGQIVKKKSSAEGDAEWADESGLKVSCTTVNNRITADKTYEDIAEALTNGINVIAVLDNQFYLLYYINEQESNSNIQFAHYEQKKLSGYIKHIMSKLIFKLDGSIEKSIDEQPAVPNADFMQRANDLGLMPAIRFDFQYFEADDSLEYINMQGSVEKLEQFLVDGTGSIVFLIVRVINNSGGLVHSDVYWCQKAWDEPVDADQEHAGHFIFSRARVGVNPNKIYIDEVEIAYSLTYYTLKSAEARTVEIAASATSSIY